MPAKNASTDASTLSEEYRTNQLCRSYLGRAAEGVGFEPTDPGGSPVFKTGALNHSAIPPSCLYSITYAAIIAVALPPLGKLLTVCLTLWRLARLRKPRLHVVEYKHSTTHPCCIEGYRVNGKRKRLFFVTRSAANKELSKIKIKLEREKAAGLAVSGSLRGGGFGL